MTPAPPEPQVLLTNPRGTLENPSAAAPSEATTTMKKRTTRLTRRELANLFQFLEDDSGPTPKERASVS